MTAVPPTKLLALPPLPPQTRAKLIERKAMSEEFFTHVGQHPHMRAMDHEFATNPDGPIAKAFQHSGFWEKITNIARGEAEELHREAAMIMHDYQATKRPFALYLRSFEAEAYFYFSPDCVPGRDGGTVTTTLLGPSSVEEKIISGLRGRLPLLAIANPAQLIVARGDIPRLQLPNEGWQQIAQNLIEYAHVIVMDCDALAPGVVWEIETIRSLQRE